VDNKHIWWWWWWWCPFGHVLNCRRCCWHSGVVVAYSPSVRQLVGSNTALVHIIMYQPSANRDHWGSRIKPVWYDLVRCQLSECVYSKVPSVGDTAEQEKLHVYKYQISYPRFEFENSLLTLTAFNIPWIYVSTSIYLVYYHALIESSRQLYRRETVSRQVFWYFGTTRDKSQFHHC